MTKEQLRAYSAIKLERDKLLKTIEEVESLLYGPRAQRSDGMPRGNGPKDDRTDALIDKRWKLRSLYESKDADLLDAIHATEAALDTLDDPVQRTLVRLYYLCGMTWEQVCVEMNYSWRQIHRIHKAALDNLKEVE